MVWIQSRDCPNVINNRSDVKNGGHYGSLSKTFLLPFPSCSSISEYSPLANTNLGNTYTNLLDSPFLTKEGIWYRCIGNLSSLWWDAFFFLFPVTL